VKIYDRQKRFPSLKSGSIVRIKAEWHNTDTQQYIKTNSADNIELISEQTITIKPEKITSPDNSDWGKIISVSGVLDTNTKTKLVLNNKNSNATIKLYSNKITKPKMKKGDIIGITGFIEVYDGEIRLIPWNNSQIKSTPIIKKASANNVEPSKISALDNNPSNLISTTTTEYRGLDEYKISESSDIRLKNNNQLQEFLTKYGIFITAIAFNLIWWGYRIWSKYRKEV
ncbi:MAG: hypothetical protein RJB24_64, partial [Candidatus Parcubacteria bacterium]